MTAGGDAAAGRDAGWSVVTITRIDRLLDRLLWLGMADFLAISAFDIHRWRMDYYQAFARAFESDAARILGQPQQSLWLYAAAFPFVAASFGAMVAMLLGRRRGVLLPFLIGSGAIAAMPLLAGQWVIQRMILPDILTAFGFAIGGAITVIVGLRLDSRSARAVDASGISPSTNTGN